MTPETAASAARASMARVYDALLGGKDNYAADRDLAARMAAADCERRDDRGRIISRGIIQRARDNRAFTAAAARRAAQAGIAQFLDLGTGLPRHPAVHETAREVIPGARCAYIDSDPVVVAHLRALLATGEGLAASAGDLADPARVLAAPPVRAVIRPGEPLCVIAAAVLHFYDPQRAREIAQGYAQRIPPGSWLAVSCACYADPELLAAMQAMYTPARFFSHGPAEVASFLEGLELIPPGVTCARRWPRGITGLPAQAAYMVCAAGRKI